MNSGMNFPNAETILQPFKFPPTPHEFKVTALRECPTPDAMLFCDTPEKAAEYWSIHITTHPFYNPEVECFAVLLLNTRRRVKRHHLVSIGTQDRVMVHSCEVFRIAIMTAACAIVIMHNHPIGESAPSDADVKVTRELIRAGLLLKMDVVDHLIVGNGNFSSLRKRGYFFQ